MLGLLRFQGGKIRFAAFAACSAAFVLGCSGNGEASDTGNQPGSTPTNPVGDLPSGYSDGMYELPADFTPGRLGGFKRGDAADGRASSNAAASGCGSILGIVRDFQGQDEANGHPDFEAYSGDDASPGIVQNTLGTDLKPVYAPSGPLSSEFGQQTTSQLAFDQWYRNDTSVNKAFYIYFIFQPNGNVQTFHSDAFFPLDGAGWGNSGEDEDGNMRNFHFTTEVHTMFRYNGGETFRFTGDDDLWVFINKKLAIDLGGLHPARSREVDLDDSAGELGIETGKDYPLDLFHAERHTDASNFRIDTNLTFTNCGIIVEDVVR